MSVADVVVSGALSERFNQDSDETAEVRFSEMGSGAKELVGDNSSPDVRLREAVGYVKGEGDSAEDSSFNLTCACLKISGD